MIVAGRRNYLNSVGNNEAQVPERPIHDALGRLFQESSIMFAGKHGENPARSTRAREAKPSVAFLRSPIPNLGNAA